jgi:hypothetical protein
LPTAIGLETTGRYLFGAINGRIPAEQFDSVELVTWIGKAAEREGGKFTGRVAAKLKALGFETRKEVGMTEFGGDPSLGDIDVLAWSAERAVVFAIECKRLAFARTIGEIGERLREYTSVAAPGDERTPIQKHLDRITYLRANPDQIARVTKLKGATLKSALVTDYLVPMQFSSEMNSFVDIVTDIRLIETKM